jgi:type I restriction enzyme S subunit
MIFNQTNTTKKRPSLRASSPLIELCSAISDCPHYTPNWTSQGKLVIRNYNIKNGRLDLSDKYYTDEETFYDRIKRHTPEPGDLIITREAPMGEVCLIPEGVECCLGQRMVLIKPDPKKVNNKYLLYTLLSEYVQKQIMKSNTSGSIVSNLCIPELEQLEIPILSLPEQVDIANVLTSLDDKISLNNRINAELEHMAKTIYDYWFVQFDFPISTAEAATMGDARLEGKPYKNSGGEMVWNEELKREVPMGWEVARLGSVLTTVLGGTPSTFVRQFWENGTIHWLNSGEIADFPIVTSELKITKEAIKNSATDLLPKGSTLLSITRHLRPTILAIDACVNQSVVGIKEKGDIKCYYLYPFLIKEIPRFMALRSGAQQPHINKANVDNSLILLPFKQSEILDKYNTTVEPLYNLIINNAFHIQELTLLRDFLLPLLMNGQVSISEK